MKNTNWKDEIKNNYGDIVGYRALGLRALRDDENYNIGDLTRNSLDWDCENDCSSDEELDGTCAVGINVMWIEDADDLIDEVEETISSAEDYGKRIVLVGGDGESQGTDPGERIIRNARVLAIITDGKK